jgi:hypothetical protein
MSRYDKVDPYSDLHRAPLAADWPVGDLGKPYAVSLNAAGKVVKGKGNSRFPRFVLVLTKARKANEIVDVIDGGELLDFAPTSGVPQTDFGVAGTDYFGDPTTGAISSTPVNGCSYIGQTVEGSRLVVRVYPHVLPVVSPT